MRAHLRAVHGIPNLSDGELWAYEAYPGSSEEAIKERQERFNQSRNVNRQAGEHSGWFHNRNADPAARRVNSALDDLDIRNLITSSISGGK